MLPLSDMCCGARSGNRPRTTKLMATMMASVEQREVLRCDHCDLVQFRRVTATCARCKRSLEVKAPEPAPLPLTLVPSVPVPEGHIQVATAVRDLRHVRNLSQRQLAARMGVPRTYISKIENGKAMPRCPPSHASRTRSRSISPSSCATRTHATKMRPPSS